MNDGKSEGQHSSLTAISEATMVIIVRAGLLEPGRLSLADGLVRPHAGVTAARQGLTGLFVSCCEWLPIRQLHWNALALAHASRRWALKCESGDVETKTTLRLQLFK